MASFVQDQIRTEGVIDEYEKVHKKVGVGIVSRYDDGVYGIRIDEDRMLCFQDLDDPNVLWAFGYYRIHWTDATN